MPHGSLCLLPFRLSLSYIMAPCMASFLRQWYNFCIQWSKIHKEKKSQFYSTKYLPILLLFLYFWSPRFNLTQKFCSNFSRSDLLIKDSFLSSSKTVFSLSSFLKVIFTGFGILGCQLFQCLKHVILFCFFFFLVSTVSVEKSVVVWMPQSYALMSRVLSFFLVFSDWIICLGLYFFGLIWGSWSFLSLESWASWIHLCISPNLRDFKQNFIKYLCVRSFSSSGNPISWLLALVILVLASHYWFIFSGSFSPVQVE